MKKLVQSWAGLLLAVLLSGALPAQAITATYPGARTNTYDATMHVYSHDTACDGLGSVAKWIRQGSSSIYSFKNNHGCDTGYYVTTGGTYFITAQACVDSPWTEETCGAWED